MLPFYQNVAAALDVDSRFEATEGMAHLVAAQPLDRTYEVMSSFCHPIAEQLVTAYTNGIAVDEKSQKKVAGTSSHVLH